MQKKVDFFYFYKSNVAVSRPRQIPAYSTVPMFPRKETRNPPKVQIPSNGINTQ